MSRRSTRLRARPTTKGRKPQRGPSRRSEQHNGCRSREREIRYTYATYLSTLTNKVLSCGGTLRREPPPAAPSQALRLDSAPSHKGRARAPARHMQGRACRALATCRPGRPSRSGGLRPKKTDIRMICPMPNLHLISTLPTSDSRPPALLSRKGFLTSPQTLSLLLARFPQPRNRPHQLVVAQAEGPKSLARVVGH